MIGFLEESAGVRSMARLTIGWMCALATMLVSTMCYVALRGRGDRNAEILAALGGGLLTIVAKGAVAIYNRNGGDAEK